MGSCCKAYSTHSFIQRVVLRAYSVEAGSPGSELQNGWWGKQKALVIKKFIVEAGNKTSKCKTVLWYCNRKGQDTSQTGDFIADFWVLALSLLLPDTLWADDVCLGLPHAHSLHFSTQRNHGAPAEFAFLAGAGDVSLGGELGQWRETISTFSLALDNCSVLPEGQHPTNDYFICWLIFTVV